MGERINVDELLRSNPIAEVIAKRIKLQADGKEFRALCPFHKERTPSFTVMPAKGRYHCFGCGADGDAIDFVMHYDRVNWREAASRLGASSVVVPLRPREPGEPAPPIENIYDGIERLAPPGNWRDLFGIGKPTPRIWNPKRELWGSFVPALVHPYLGAEGELLGLVLRRNYTLSGKAQKETPQIGYVRLPNGEECWCRIPFPEPRPLYGLDRLAGRQGKAVLVVEGEKACDAAAAFDPPPPYVPVTWAGGSNGARKTDWSPVAGRDVLLWPDADLPGWAAMRGYLRERDGELMKGVGHLCLDAGARSVRILNVLEGQEVAAL